MRQLVRRARFAEVTKINERPCGHKAMLEVNLTSIVSTRDVHILHAPFLVFEQLFSAVHFGASAASILYPHFCSENLRECISKNRKTYKIG